jgi:hypothetical protein
VAVTMLEVTEIEGAYTESAVRRWIESNGGDPSIAAGFSVHAAIGTAKAWLKEVTKAQWNRQYHAPKDGEAIAEFMSAGEIGRQIGDWLRMLVAD